MWERAASIVRNAEVFVITAGAGMGVDSGLPDFRGDTGFWHAYPAYARLGLSFVDCANPQHFADVVRCAFEERALQTRELGSELRITFVRSHGFSSQDTDPKPRLPI